MTHSDVLPFLGRKKEIHQLQQILNQTQKSGTQLCLISAPPGFGKTHLIRHFVRQQSTPCPFTEGRGWDNRAATPYHALQEALTYLNEKTGNTTTSPTNTLLHQNIPEATLFPELAHIFQEHASPTLIVFLDDLQWADEGTLEWFDFARLRFQNHPILWIGAYRAAFHDTLLLKTRTNWAAEKRLTEIRLAPLQDTDLTNLPTSNPHFNPQQALQNAGGVPLFFVAEWHHTQNGVTSPQISGQTLIQYQLSELSRQVYELLQWAAVIGERFDFDTLSQATKHPPRDLASTLNELALHKTIIQADEYGFQFSHSWYREALLEKLTPPIRRYYHTQLAQLNTHQKTYHLIHTGDTETSIQALMVEGDACRGKYAWKDALRYYTEIQLLLQESEDDFSNYRHQLYERLGDIQLLFAKEPDIARGYYEAAIQYTNDLHLKVRLYCRIAETYRSPYQHVYYPQIEQHLKTAENLLTNVPNRELQAWITCIRAEIGYGGPDEQLELIEKVLEAPTLPQEIAHRSRRVLSIVACYRGDESIYEHTSPSLSVAYNDRYQTARKMLDDVNTYFQLGKLQKALRYARDACQFQESLGLYEGVANVQRERGLILWKLGLIHQSREAYYAALRTSDEERLYQTYHRLCQTWISDRTPEGLEWARKALSGWVKIVRSRKDWVIGYCLHDPGPIERIFYFFDVHQEFKDQMDSLQDHMKAIGYPAPVRWYFDHSQSRPAIQENRPPEEWTFEPRGPEPTWETQDKNITLYGGKSQICGMPELTTRVQGDFVLQTTIQGDPAKSADLEQSQIKLGTGQPLGQVEGTESLVVSKDRQNNLRLFAHIREPGEVMFEVCQSNFRCTLGRGFMPDSKHIHLRIEKNGDHFSTFVGNDSGQWFSCGELDLPGWDQLKVGIHSEPSVEIYGLCKQTKSTFLNTKLWVKNSAPSISPKFPTEQPTPPPELVYHSDLPNILISGKKMHRLVEELSHLGNSGASVLISGETGTGKEIAARLCHHHSPQKKGPFIPLNCAAMPEDLLERELFGTIRGAYTGAIENRGGLFEAAHNGTLFLDEIGDISPAFQAKLLRILEDHQVRRLGETRYRPIKVRILCATNKNLEKLVEEGTFRQDLYYRLAARTINIPPLRKRTSEIPSLVHHMLSTYSHQQSSPLKTITREAIENLKKYHWPGNIRELQHLIGQASDNAKTDLIYSHDLNIPKPTPQIQISEKERIRQVLSQTQNNRAEAARQLGISRNTLYRRIKQLGI